MSALASIGLSTDKNDEELKYKICQDQVLKLQEKIERLKDEQDNEILRKESKIANIIKINELNFNLIKILQGHTDKIYDSDWSNDSKLILSCSQDGHLIVWNAKQQKKKLNIVRENTWLMSAVFSPGNEMIACGGLDNLCSIYPFKILVNSNKINITSPPALQLQHHEGYISSIKYLNNDKIITASGDSTILLWDIHKHNVISSFLDHSQDCTAISVKRDDENIFLSASVDTSIKLWDIRTKKCVGDFMYHDADVTCIQWFPNNYSFISGSEDSSCILLDIKAYKPVNIYADDDITSGVTSVSLSNSGRILFAGYDDDPYGIVWDTAYANNLGNLKHNEKVSTLQVSPDGTLICTSSWDRNLRLWQYSS